MSDKTALGDPRLPERIWQKIQVDPGPGCWLWTASKNRGGYGQVYWQGRSRKIYVVTYEVLVGPRQGLDLDHLCRVRACCNPAHLEPCTRRENLGRGQGLIWMQRRARTECKYGHPFIPENTLHDGQGRVCKTCRRASQRAYKLRKKASNA